VRKEDYENLLDEDHKNKSLISDYIYVGKVTFEGNDGNKYFWYYDNDDDLMPEEMMNVVLSLGYNPFETKRSKVKFVKKDSVQLMKLYRRSKVKERFKKFLLDTP